MQHRLVVHSWLLRLQREHLLAFWLFLSSNHDFVLTLFCPTFHKVLHKVIYTLKEWMYSFLFAGFDNKLISMLSCPVHLLFISFYRYLPFVWSETNNFETRIQTADDVSLVVWIVTHLRECFNKHALFSHTNITIKNRVLNRPTVTRYLLCYITVASYLHIYTLPHILHLLTFDFLHTKTTQKQFQTYLFPRSLYLFLVAPSPVN